MNRDAKLRYYPIFALLGAIAVLCALMWAGQRVPQAPQPVPAPAPAIVPDVPAPAPQHQPTEFIEGVTVQADGSLALGYVPNPEETREFVASLPAANITEASPGLFADTPKVNTTNWRVLAAVWREKMGSDFVVGQQKIGDCVSWGWAHGIMVTSAIDYQRGESSEWLPVATESIYGGSRVEARGQRLGGYSDGSYGGAAAKWVHDWGVVFRQKYDSVDLTIYSGERAKDWGNFGNGGRDDGGKLDTTAKDHPVFEVTLVRNFDEAAAALTSGYMVPVCSSQGFSSKRDAKGFASPQGSWAHCMCFTDVRYDPDGLLCQNSWGPNWISGPKDPPDQPDGSFWVDKQTANRMLRGEDSFAVSRIKGFPFRPLDHSDWATVTTQNGTELARRKRKPRYVPEPIFSQAL